MTTLCAYQREPGGSIWIGSDQQQSFGDTSEWLCCPKWRILAGFGAFGAAGAAVAIELGELVLRGRPGSGREFGEMIRARCEEISWAPDCRSGEAPNRQASAMAVLGGQLWYIELGTGLAQEIPVGEFAAYGTGGDFALGAAHASMDLDPGEILFRAIEAAIRYDVWSGGDPWIRELRPAQEPGTAPA